jgi:UDP-N-acetylglucosamine 2-epimerase
LVEEARFMKVMTVVGTRPEIIRLSRVICALDDAFDHILVHTGQNYDYELSQTFFEDLGLRAPDCYLDAAGPTPAETIGNVIIAADGVLRDRAPDAVLVLGDTNSCLAAIPAKRRRIPVFHMEAGNRCFDDRVPEEINRRIVDHVADVNLPYSDISREYPYAEGIAADRIVKTGSPMFEVLRHYRERVLASTILTELNLTASDYFVVSVHREENVDDPVMLRRFLAVLAGLDAEYHLPIIVSTHPRTRQRIASAEWRVPPAVRLLPPFRFSDYVHLELNAQAVLSDSGTLTEEASILNFPALMLRDTHERPEGMEEATVIMTGMSWPRVREALAVERANPGSDERRHRLVSDYAMGSVSDKIVRLIMSYTHYVNRVVWARAD